jgi:hypothetical protein
VQIATEGFADVPRQRQTLDASALTVNATVSALSALGYHRNDRLSPLGSLTARRRGILRFAAPAEGADERPAGGAIIFTFRPKKT